MPCVIDDHGDCIAHGPSCITADLWLFLDEK